MAFFKAMGRLITTFAYMAGVSILLMIIVTLLDVILRIFNVSITGIYDLVRALGVISVAFALPYVTAVKGHIAIEYFYLKCGRGGRFFLDTLFRISALIIFGILAFQTFKHGLSLFRTGEVFPTLKLPVFWIPLVISFNSVLMMIIFIYHLLNPGKEYIKP